MRCNSDSNEQEACCWHAAKCLQGVKKDLHSGQGDQGVRYSPTRPTRSPFLTSQETSFSTCWSLKVIATCNRSSLHQQQQACVASMCI